MIFFNFATYTTTTVHHLQYKTYSTYLQRAILKLVTILYSTYKTVLTYNVRYATNNTILCLQHLQYLLTMWDT